MMINIPEYADALKTSKVPLNDESVYEILRSTYLQILSKGANNIDARNVLKSVLKDVTGDTLTWDAG